jgi:hypothetical protein
MRLLFIGDIVGSAATAYVAERLPQLRSAHAVDLVVANAENCVISGPDPRTGYGMGLAPIEQLLAAGVDVITSGNHAWDSPESDAVLAHPRVVRPLNVPPGRSGKGLISLEVGGERVTVLNLADSEAISEASPPVAAWQTLGLSGTVVVDFHGGLVQSKHEFAFAVDGQAAAVLGTHTHEPTLLLHRLPGGTAFVAEVGMTGPSGGILGVAASYFTAPQRHPVAPRFSLAPGPIVLGAVLLQIENGLACDITRIR